MQRNCPVLLTVHACYCLKYSRPLGVLRDFLLRNYFILYINNLDNENRNLMAIFFNHSQIHYALYINFKSCDILVTWKCNKVGQCH